ncbi:Uncharacterised protein [Mycobacterium tuberculosis]|nr:Uncharacterised protein [Mycobacterium tuberculosis]
MGKVNNAKTPKRVIKIEMTNDSTGLLINFSNMYGFSLLSF